VFADNKLGQNPGSQNPEPLRSPSPEAEAKFIRINQAYEALIEGKPGARQTLTGFSKAKSRKKTRAQAERQKIRERLKDYAIKKQAKFLKEREEYRASKYWKCLFYAEVWIYFGMAGVITVIPIAVAIYNRHAIFLVLLLMSVRVGTPLYVKGTRLKKRADMIFGPKEDFTLRELQEIYFYKEPQGRMGSVQPRPTFGSSW
jgi:hypothetical protein